MCHWFIVLYTILSQYVCVYQLVDSYPCICQRVVLTQPISAVRLSEEADASCTCQLDCPGCKCRKIVCLSKWMPNICLITNAWVWSITCLKERDCTGTRCSLFFDLNRFCFGLSCSRLLRAQAELEKLSRLFMSTEVCLLNKAHLLSCCCERETPKSCSIATLTDRS